MNNVYDADTVAFQKLSDVAQYRSDLYRLFALCFSNPSPSFVALIQDGALIDNLQPSLSALSIGEEHYEAAMRRLSDLTTAYAELDVAVLLSQLRIEYMRLFIGPRTLETPIYETLYREEPSSSGEPLLFVSPTAIKVEAQYHEAGVRMATHDSPDHLVTELEFMVYLCDKEVQAWEVANNTMAKKWRRLEQKFLDEHLGKWSMEFCHQVQEAARQPFYRDIATLADVFLTMETGAFRPR